MKKIYTLFCLLTITTVVLAQVNLPLISARTVNSSYYQNLKKGVSNKTANCIDTIRYPASRLTGVEVLDSMKVGYIEGISQAYHFTGNGLVHGISAYVAIDLDGVPSPSDSISMIISVYTITDASTVPFPGYPNKPTVLIATDTVDVYDVGFKEQALMFSKPVAVTDSFAIVLELDQSDLPARAPWYAYNNNGDGKKDKLAWAIYAGGLYNADTDWPGDWDSDMMLSPIFEQTYTASYTVDTDTICLSDTVVFTNTTSPNSIDSMFYTAIDSFFLDLDDLSTVNSFTSNYKHVYTAGGSYNPQLVATRFGYGNNCVDSPIDLVVVHDTSIAKFGFTDMNGGTFQFSDSSSSTSNWSWNFGDSSPVDITKSPSHTYVSVGTYYVCLTASNSNGCNTNVFCDSVKYVIPVGIDDYYAADYVRVYPIPAHKYFNVNVPSNYYEGDIIITDVVGEQLKIVAIENQEKVKVSTEGIASGIYFVSIEYNGERIFTKRIVIDR